MSFIAHDEVDLGLTSLELFAGTSVARSLSRTYISLRSCMGSARSSLSTHPLIADDQNMDATIVCLLLAKLFSSVPTKLVIFASFFSSMANTLNAGPALMVSGFHGFAHHFVNSFFQLLIRVAGQTTSARPILQRQLLRQGRHEHLALIEERRLP